MNDVHVQVKLFTKQTKYATPDTPYSLPFTCDASQLNGLLAQFLQTEKSVEFNFLINGISLSSDIENHADKHQLSLEEVIEIEYIEKYPSPLPDNSLLLDDWVSGVRCFGQLVLTASYDNTLRLWSAKGKPLATIPGHTAPVKTVEWLKLDENDGVKQFISGSHDQTILLWLWDSCSSAVEAVHTYRGHTGSVDCIAISEDNTRFVSGSWDTSLKLWSTDSGETPNKRAKGSAPGEEREAVYTMMAHKEGISGVQWVNETSVCTSSWDHSLRLWDLQKAEEISTMTSSKVFLGCSFSPLNKSIITCSADRYVRLFDPRCFGGNSVKASFTSHTAWVSCVNWSPKSEYHFISGGYDAVLKLWDTRNCSASLYDMEGHKNKILCCDWSLTNYMMSGGADNKLRIFSHEGV